jgi:hypothetical protein
MPSHGVPKTSDVAEMRQLVSFRQRRCTTGYVSERERESVCVCVNEREDKSHIQNTHRRRYRRVYRDAAVMRCTGTSEKKD